MLKKNNDKSKVFQLGKYYEDETLNEFVILSKIMDLHTYTNKLQETCLCLLTTYLIKTF